MTVIQSNLFYVVKKFPHLKDSIIQFFKENQNFQTICEDYRQCAEALRHWKKSTSKEAPARRDEYEALMRDLETEILQSLNEF
jgi:hypothetical protein